MLIVSLVILIWCENKIVSNSNSSHNQKKMILNINAEQGWMKMNPRKKSAQTNEQKCYRRWTQNKGKEQNWKEWSTRV